MAFVKRTKLPSGTVVYRAVWDEAGKRRSKNFPRERDAKAHASLMHDRVGRLGIADIERLTFSAFAARHVANLEARGQNPCTLVAYRHAVTVASPFFGRKRLAEISPLDIDAMTAALLKGGTDKKAMASSTVSTIKNNISGIMTAARKAWIIPSNPCADAMSVSGGRRNKPRAFSVPELRQLLDAADAAESAAPFPGLATLVRFFLLTGSRRAEALGLRWSRVDLDGGTITIDATCVCATGKPVLREQTKTEESARTISIPNDLVERLRLHKIEQMKARLQWGREWKDTDIVFARADGALLWPTQCTTVLRRVMKAAGLAGRQPCHGYRHSAASLMLAKSGDVVAISKRLGHGRVSTTLDIYGHSDHERDKAAAGIVSGLLTGVS
jgi:integrase